MTDSRTPNEQTLLRTPLFDLHRELGATLVPFAGYEMPVRYPAGIIKEHQQTRSRAGLFDVSHMGQVRLTGHQSAQALESLVPGDVVELGALRQRYTLFTNEAGGILDDLMVTNTGDGLFLVVNAARKEHDVEHLRAGLEGRCTVEVLNDRALLALQGPSAAEVMGGLNPVTKGMVFMTAARVTLAGADCFVTRSGYTGEDGFEISVPAERAEALARLLLAQAVVAPAGLGARDSLRLEAGLCLYGHDIDAETTPVEAGLSWAVARVRRSEGARAGGYPGTETIERQLREGVSRRRVGIRALGRVPVRDGAVLRDEAGSKVGSVTSGGYGPSVQGPVAMGYVESRVARIGTALSAEVRGRGVPVRVEKMPFVPQRYYRGSGERGC